MKLPALGNDIAKTGGTQKLEKGKYDFIQHLMTANNNVLIVDDEPEICMLLASIIEKYNLVPVYVHTVTDALIAAEKIQPGLTFLDINLPDGNGLDLLSKFTFRYPMMKVVMISAYDRHRNTAMSIGAHGFLSKPFTKSSVTDVLMSKT